LEKFQSNDNLESGKSSLKSPEESPSERAQENVARPRRAPRILVVDDSLDAQLILRDLLSKRGYEVISAPEAQTARDLLRSQHPDLIVLDIVMPGKSGYEFCHELKQDPLTKLIPIVIVTGLSERDDHIRAIEAGADDFLNKPVYPEELFARIKALLTTKEFMDNLENAEVVLVTLALGIESRDLYTGSHCRVVAHYASDFGHYVGLNEENIVALKRGGYLHDLGKVSVSDDILKKSSSLSPAEWENNAAASDHWGVHLPALQGIQQLAADHAKCCRLQAVQKNGFRRSPDRDSPSAGAERDRSPTQRLPALAPPDSWKEHVAHSLRSPRPPGNQEHPSPQWPSRSRQPQAGSWAPLQHTRQTHQVCFANKRWPCLSRLQQ
jgi:DNA-binding response OmpR family regulator